MVGTNVRDPWSHRAGMARYRCESWSRTCGFRSRRYGTPSQWPRTRSPRSQAHRSADQRQPLRPRSSCWSLSGGGGKVIGDLDHGPFPAFGLVGRGDGDVGLVLAGQCLDRGGDGLGSVLVDRFCAKVRVVPEWPEGPPCRRRWSVAADRARRPIAVGLQSRRAASGDRVRGGAPTRTRRRSAQ